MGKLELIVGGRGAVASTCGSWSLSLRDGLASGGSVLRGVEGWVGGIGGRGGMRVAAGAGVRRVGGRSVVGVGVEGRGAVVGDIGIPIGTATRLELLPAIRTVPLGALGRQMLSTNT
jgi:hypothetical protein